MWVRFMPVDMCTSGSFIFRAAEKPVAGICHFSKEPWQPLRGLGVGGWPTRVALITGRSLRGGDPPTFISPPLWGGRAGLVPSASLNHCFTEQEFK